ncbi:hypothetical protein TSOC_006205 [Tetrabaena socialis]|uniref:Uncharacterized protein n=1 Tax=Tetrabaena socialis TaxID=47790 RepID=A0A2J8A4A7_9CHLO|nr:hypothetical protein TSOC_006205 [Tetrabaena socialis]|eukprot:PNH07338.1 hypothetical protein TSOC_006205 [Tetrabaena socialis]
MHPGPWAENLTWLSGLGAGLGGSGVGLLVAPNAMTDLCAAACLVLEGLAAEGDARSFMALLASLLAAVSDAIADFAATIVAAATGGGLLAARATGGSVRMAAAAQESAAAALAALQASCRQLGAACTRAAASTAAATVAVTARPTAAAGSCPAVSATASPSVLVAAADMVRGAAAAVASSAAAGSSGSYCTPAVPPGSEMWAAAAGPSAAAAPGGSEDLPSPVTDPRITLAVLAAAAGGLLEGCAAAAALQPPQLRPPLLRWLRPAGDRLAAVCLDAAAAATSTSGPAQRTLGSLDPQFESSRRPHPGPDPDPPMFPRTLLRLAVGYCWARMKLGPGLPGLLDLPGVADRMVAAAAAAAGPPEAGVSEIGMAGVQGAEGWHPSRGALGMLLCGSLGVGRVLAMAAAGANPAAAAELLDCQVRGPLFADMQLLARGALEGARPGAAAAEAGVGAAGALQLLCSVAPVAARLHAMYGGVADDGRGGRAWLAALPAAAAGALRDLLDRTFVVIVSVVAAAYDAVAAAHNSATAAAGFQENLPAAPCHGWGYDGGGRAVSASMAAERQAAAAVSALGVLADLQFIGLPLRAHGELVARLSAAVSSSAEQAAAPLLELLPCYAPLAAAYGNGGAAVSVSRLAFLLPLAASCVPHAPDISAAAAAVLPYIFLLLKGAPSEAVCQTAHAVWAALLAALCEEGVEAGDGVAVGGVGGGGAAMIPCDGRHQQQQHAGVELAASMVPYYVVRTCQPPCTEAEVELIERGLRQCTKSLPLAHPAKSWCLRRLAQQLAEWAHESKAAIAAAGALQTMPSAGLHGPSPLSSPAAAAPLLPLSTSQLGAAGVPTEAVLRLVRRAAAALGLLTAEADFPLIPDALAALDELMEAPPLADASCRAAVLQQLHDTWLRSDDYARKPLLEEWLRRAVATALPAAGVRQGEGAGVLSRLSVRLG